MHFVLSFIPPLNVLRAFHGNLGIALIDRWREAQKTCTKTLSFKPLGVCIRLLRKVVGIDIIYYVYFRINLYFGSDRTPTAAAVYVVHIPQNKTWKNLRLLWELPNSSASPPVQPAVSSIKMGLIMGNEFVALLPCQPYSPARRCSLGIAALRHFL